MPRFLYINANPIPPIPSPQIHSGGAWDEDDEGDDEEDEATEADGAGGGDVWVDDADDREEGEEVIAAEESGSVAAGAAPLLEGTAGADDVLSRPVPSWRDPRHPVLPEEYTATLVLETACLSIDRRPNNQGMELSVTSESLGVLDETPALHAAMEPAGAAATSPPPPVKVSELDL